MKKTRKRTTKEYRVIYAPEYSRAQSNGYTKEHLVVAEKVLGKPLPVGVVVHHIDGDKGNNQPNNLILCEDKAYHHLIHKRKRAFEVCGHASWLRCSQCEEYLPVEQFVFHKAGTRRHRDCPNKDKYSKIRVSSIVGTNG